MNQVDARHLADQLTLQHGQSYAVVRNRKTFLSKIGLGFEVIQADQSRTPQTEMVYKTSANKTLFALQQLEEKIRELRKETSMYQMVFDKMPITDSKWEVSFNLLQASKTKLQDHEHFLHILKNQ